MNHLAGHSGKNEITLDLKNTKRFYISKTVKGLYRKFCEKPEKLGILIFLNPQKGGLLCSSSYLIHSVQECRLDCHCTFIHIRKVFNPNTFFLIHNLLWFSEENTNHFGSVIIS